MIRNEKRKQLRELEKEHKRIVGNKRFNNILNSEEFANMTDEKIEELKAHKSNNREEQAKFDFVYLLITRVRELERKIAELKALPNK